MNLNITFRSALLGGSERDFDPSAVNRKADSYGVSNVATPLTKRDKSSSLYSLRQIDSYELIISHPAYINDRIRSQREDSLGGLWFLILVECKIESADVFRFTYFQNKTFIRATKSIRWR